MAEEIKKRTRRVSAKTKIANIDKKIAKLKAQIADLEKEKIALEGSVAKEKLEAMVEHIKNSGISVDELKKML